jgi:hypothetical protein
MLDARDDARLGEELRLEIRGQGKRGVEYLDGDIALQQRVMRTEYRGEPPDAKYLAEFELLANRGREARPEEIDVEGQRRMIDEGIMLEVTASCADREERAGTRRPGAGRGCTR